MAERQPTEKTDIRERILAVALRLFADQGFEATSLQAIADEVGVRKQSLLYHYSSKDALRRAVLEDLASHWSRVLPRLLKAATSGEDEFQSVVAELISFFMADTDRARLIVREVLDRPADVEAVRNEHVDPWVEIVCRHIRRGQEQGRIRGDVDPEAYVLHIVSIVMASMAFHRGVGAVHRQRLTTELLRIARHSLFLDESNGELLP